VWHAEKRATARAAADELAATKRRIEKDAQRRRRAKKASAAQAQDINRGAGAGSPAAKGATEGEGRPTASPVGAGGDQPEESEAVAGEGTGMIVSGALCLPYPTLVRPAGLTGASSCSAWWWPCRDTEGRGGLPASGTGGEPASQER
jgi:hypothetical protein